MIILRPRLSYAKYKILHEAVKLVNIRCFTLKNMNIDGQGWCMDAFARWLVLTPAPGHESDRLGALDCRSAEGGRARQGDKIEMDIHGKLELKLAGSDCTGVG